MKSLPMGRLLGEWTDGLTRFFLLGGTGFIGMNLAARLSENPFDQIVLAGLKPNLHAQTDARENVEFLQVDYAQTGSLQDHLEGTDVLIHLASTTVPASSNLSIPNELSDIQASAELFDACVSSDVSQVLFVSSGGAVYGNGEVPFKEASPQNPISTYGLQKLSIEKLLEVYRHVYGLEYRVVRPSNPYGPFQSPTSGQGVIASFISCALRGEPLTLIGDGEVVRDFIYIGDLVECIVRVLKYDGDERVFNLGTGVGTRICEVIEEIRTQIPTAAVSRVDARGADVSKSILDDSLFQRELGPLSYVSLGEGISKTIEFQRGQMAC